MFDIGFLELVIVAVIALLILGPERMPTAVRQVSRWVRTAKRLMHDWSAEVNRQIDNDALQKSIKEELAVAQVNEDIRQLNSSVNDALNIKSFVKPQDQIATVDEFKKTSDSVATPVPVSIVP
jgi:sec-independent protein translocase protein TatB